MANTRSRNYPAMSLGEAIERAGILYKREGRAKVDAASAVAAWGYGSLNGASLRVVSALRQYGLLEGSNEELRLSESGLTLLLEPPSSSEYSAALQAALTAPSLYREVLDEYTDGLPSDPAMISYLVRKQGLGEAAAKSVLESFRKSLELIDDHDKQYLAPQVSSNVSANERQAIKPNSLEVKELEQSKPGINLNFAWPLSANTVLTLRITGDIPSDEDMSILPQVLDLARTQIARSVTAAAQAAARAASGQDAEYTVE